MSDEETARQVARQWFDHAHLDWPPHEHEVLVSLIAAALAAERQRCARAIKAAATKERAAAADADNVIAHEYHWDRFTGLHDAAEIVQGLK